MAKPLRRVLESVENERDPFVFGWRMEFVRQPGGGVEERQVPLNAADLLDPQINDYLACGSHHVGVCRMLFDLFDRRYRAEKDVFISSDLKICWGIEGLPDPAPDVAVIRGVRDKEENRDSFDVVREGVLPCLIVEVVSSRTAEHRRADYEKKVAIYERAGVPEYVIVDPQLHLKRPKMRISGYRREASGRYRAIAPDREGRLLSESTGLWFTVSADGQRLWLVDAVTGERLLTSREVEDLAERESESRRLAEARAKREAESRRLAEDHAERKAAELEQLRAELARLKGSHS